MNKAERFIKKYLDESEQRLLIRYDRWLETVFAHIPFGIGETEIHQYHLPQPAFLSSILFQHSAEMLTAGQAHGDAEAKHIRDKHRVKLADLPVIDGNREFTPEEAMVILKKREMKLAGEVEADLVTAIKQILMEYLLGASPKSTQGSIANLLKDNRDRASLITTTETTYAYNRGRLISYRENNVDYVRFSAIMDGRTSQICRSRQGLVMGMEDPELGANTPPLHGRCRSVLTPIYSRYEPGLITDKNTDWSDAAPLPKGWKTGGNAVSKSPAPTPGKTDRDTHSENGYTEGKKDIEKHYKAVKKKERDITKNVKNVVKLSGGKMTGLEDRLKTKDSFFRKVESDYKVVKLFDNKATPLGVARKINDAIRYTVIATVADYIHTYFRVIQGLADQGYTLVKTKNTWTDPNSAYKGVNSILKDPQGQTFELQFHTPESFDAKQYQMHVYYEEQRLDTTTPERKKELELLMLQLSNRLVKPNDINKIK